MVATGPASAAPQGSTAAGQESAGESRTGLTGIAQQLKATASESVRDLIRASPPPTVPIVASCIPFIDTRLSEKGCVLRVSSAAAGSTISFRLKDADGRLYTPTVRLAAGATEGGRRWALEEYSDGHDRRSLPAFTGSASYAGDAASPEYEVSGWDPAASVKEGRFCPSYGTARFCRKAQFITVPLGAGETVTVLQPL